MNSETFKELTKNYPDSTQVFVSNMTEDYTLANPLESRTSCTLAEGSFLYCDFNDLSGKKTTTLKDLRSIQNEIIDIDVEDGFVFRSLEKVLYIDDYLILFSR